MKKMMLAAAFAAFAAGELAAASAVDLEFLKDLIRIPSVSADVAEVNRAAEFTRRSAELKGLFCQIETNAVGRSMVWVANVEGKTPDVLLSAHIDVVPAQSPDLFVPKESVDARGAHAPSEHVNIGSLDEYADLISRFLATSFAAAR